MSNVEKLVSPSLTSERVEDREAAFWDGVAAEIANSDLSEDVNENDPLISTRLRMLGDLKGKKVLDVGCGTGFWAVAMARRGAEVWAIDISPGSVEVVKKRAEKQNVDGRVHASVMSATELEFPDKFFDVVHGQDIIHHVDGTDLGKEVARVLVPGGHAVFHENCANNKMLMFARDNICGRFGVPKWSSDDEYPLTRKKMETFTQFFEKHQVQYPTFMCFRLFDAKIFHYRNRLVRTICNGLDSMCYSIPPMRQFSYVQVLRCDNPKLKP